MLETIVQLQSITWLVPTVKIGLCLCLAVFGWLAIFVWIVFLKEPIPKWLAFVATLLCVLFSASFFAKQSLILEFLASFSAGLCLNSWLAVWTKKNKVSSTGKFKITFILSMFVFVVGLVFFQFLMSTDEKILRIILDNLRFGLEVTLIGNLVVFSALVLVWQIMDAFRTNLWGVPERLIMLCKWLLAKRQPTPVTATEAQNSQSTATATTPEKAITPEIIVAITAAVTVAIDKKFRITRIRYRHLPPEGAWNKQGIASIMGSHNPKRYHS